MPNPLNKSFGKKRAGKYGNIPKALEINGVKYKFRSTSEAKYAIRLENMRKAGIITGWKYEPRFFEFPGVKHGITRYKPDFEIIEISGVSEFIEIKGYIKDSDKTKMRRMKKYHPDVKIKMLDSKKFEVMRWE